MAKKGKMSRRSFLGSVGGVGALGAGLLVTGCATQQGPGYTGITDADGGRYADRAGHGRGGQRPARSGVTDADPWDPAGNGRGRAPRSGQTTGGRRGTCTDADTNMSPLGTDPAGRGRHC